MSRGIQFKTAEPLGRSKAIIGLDANDTNYTFAVAAHNVFFDENTSLDKVINDIYDKINNTYTRKNIKNPSEFLCQPLKRTNLNIYMKNREV